MPEKDLWINLTVDGVAEAVVSFNQTVTFHDLDLSRDAAMLMIPQGWMPGECVSSEVQVVGHGVLGDDISFEAGDPHWSGVEPGTYTLIVHGQGDIDMRWDHGDGRAEWGLPLASSS